MSPPHLAQELLDHIVDHLHQDHQALQECSLVSKSWIPRTRKHLFAEVKLTDRRKFKLWKHAFPDPTSSPGHYTKFLSIYSLYATFESKEAEAGGWIKAFCNTVSFKVYTRAQEHNSSDDGYNITFEEGDQIASDKEDDAPFDISLVPFHGFSLALKSLTVGISHLPSKEVLQFILSFQRLEDLTVFSGLGEQNDYDGEEDQMNLQIPSAFPPLTGTLDIMTLRFSLGFTVDKLLRLPNGIHFQALRLRLEVKGDSPSERRVATIRDLVEQCSPTLKDLVMVFDGEFM
jgi:hypothetical protein